MSQGTVFPKAPNALGVARALLLYLFVAEGLSKISGDGGLVKSGGRW